MRNLDKVRSTSFVSDGDILAVEKRVDKAVFDNLRRKIGLGSGMVLGFPLVA